MALEFIEDSKLRGGLLTLGKTGLNALYPNEFELYIVGLELVDPAGKTVEFFIFPINPSSIEEVNTPLTNIKKTAGGITILSTNTFVPVNINLRGNFGRKLKFLMNQELINFAGVAFGEGNINVETAAKTLKDKIVGNFKKGIFSRTLKTGYGCIKTLERICTLSNELDETTNKPYSLYFYNLALGNSYLVKYMNLTFNQDQSSNMIWNYNLQLTGILPVDQVKSVSQRGLTASMSSQNILQKAGNQALNSARALLKQVA